MNCPLAIKFKTNESHAGLKEEDVPYIRPLQRLLSSASLLQIRMLRNLSDAQRLGSMRASL